MLKNNGTKRLLSAIVLIVFLVPPSLLSAYAGPGGKIAGLILISLIGMWGYWEILVAMKFSKITSLISSLAIPLFMILPLTNDFKSVIYDSGWTLFSLIRYGLKSWIPWVILIAFSLLPLVLDWKFSFKKVIFKKQFFILLITLIIPLFSKAVWLISIASWTKFLFFALIAVISDILAYLGGYLFGKKWFKGKKLAPKISPKKTWAGFIIGLGAAITFAILYGYFMHVWDIFDNELLWSIIFGIILSIISPLGDLLFSWIKRNEKIKDFSNLIPGHGGIFDRLDAMSVVFCIGSILLMMA